ncbi:MAG: sugar O-acetyltransferase precursor [Bacteroidetes bacterium]|nr:sugar O-acetyltransferase precursor [Bacteroidota bacterium]
MKRINKITVLAIILFVMLAPLIQKQFKVVREPLLFGSFSKSDDTTLTLASWLDKSYQIHKEKYLNENFGLRNYFVKLNNQVSYSLFQEMHVNDVFRGKKNYLYSYKFYNSYSGQHYNDSHADSVIQSLRVLNKKLKDQKIKLLVCFAPCKESFYPEFLPDTFLSKVKARTYYSVYKEKLVKNNIPLLDYQNYFQKLKANSSYPLFIQGAVHWTTYGAYIALDTLLKRIAFETSKNVNLIKIKSVELSDTARGSDDDISKAFNLFQNLNSGKLAYPTIEYVRNNDSCYKPKVLLIGDSFYYGLNNTWIPSRVFSKESYFLYYFRQAFAHDGRPDQDVVNLDMKKELSNTNIVILFFSVGTLDNFPYGASKISDNIPSRN